MTDPVERRRCVQVFVSGHVQGVWYRGSMQQEARRRGLRGWVRNLPDGRVEAMIAGDANDVAEMIVWCEGGPQGAQVSGVRIVDEPPNGGAGFDSLADFEKFEIVR